MRTLRFEAISKRLCQTDMLQLLTAYFTLLLFVLMVTWPQTAERANNSWYALTQANLSAIVLLSVSYGAFVSNRSIQERVVTLAALFCFVLLSVPLEVASYAASFPAVPLGWSWLLTLLNLVAFFGLGLAVGLLLDLGGVRALLPLAVPLLLIGLILIDLWLNRAVFNPLPAISQITFYHPMIMVLLSSMTLILLVRTPTTKEVGA